MRDDVLHAFTGDIYIYIYHRANSSSTLQLNFAPIHTLIYQNTVSSTGPHLQSQTLAIFNFSMSINTKFALRHFCSQCASVGRKRKLRR